MMKILDTLNHIQLIIKKNPAILGHPAIRKSFNALEKAAVSFESAADPFQNIRYSEYLELKEALKGKTTQKTLPATNSLLAKFGLSIPVDRNGKAQLEPFLIHACEKGSVSEIIKELKRKPEDIYREQLFLLTKWSDSSLRSHIDKSYSDPELKKFMKANSIKEGKRQKKYNRNESIENVIYKIIEARSRI